jgi:superfamily II DNA/RNA helicase
MLQAEGRGLSMVFVRTRRTADKVAEDLAHRGFAAAAVHGDLGQGQREQALRAFRSGKVDVLVATDVAARGIDVGGVTHVVNYQCPEDESVYLHRIGRTGRAGGSGVAVTFVDWDDVARWQLVNKALELPFEEPLETYSTSPHLFELLGIPAEATGVLPRAARTRAGLAAEEIEDLGGGKRARGRARTAGGEPRAGRDAAKEAAKDAAASRSRTRRRTRGAGAAAAAAGLAGEEEAAGEADVAVVMPVEPALVTEPADEAATTAEVTELATEADDEAPRRRRRRRGGRGRSGRSGTELVADGDQDAEDQAESA